jgi:membrane-bound lytic murein transglycosylase B
MFRISTSSIRLGFKIVAASFLFIIVSNHSYANYSERLEVQQFIDDVHHKYKIDKTKLDYIFSKARPQSSIVKIMTPKPKKTKQPYTPWYIYRTRFVTETRIRRGVKFWNTHRAVLDRAEKTFGVPKEIIVAIIGVETSYGRTMGTYRAIDALTTLAFDSPRRNDFFKAELVNFLLMTDQLNLPIFKLKSSYAGAMGYGQFLPSSYNKYAIDFDHDGKVDIWENPIDAIGSVANYFNKFNWLPNQPVVSPAYVRGKVDTPDANEYREVHTTIKKLKKRGIIAIDYNLSPNTPVGLIKLKEEHGPQFWLGLHNFFVITEYNHSRRYALAVYQLAQKIKMRINNK